MMSVAQAGALISDPASYQQNIWPEPFAVLRREDPLHYVEDSPFGPFWAVTKFEDIKAVETNTDVFSSEPELGGIQIRDIPPELSVRSFFLMDPPDHDKYCAVVNPIGLPRGVAHFEALIREKTRTVLDTLPRGKPFDWVDRLSIEITSTMLAALMAYPIDDRRELVFWSEVMACTPGDPGSPVATEEEREAEKLKFFNRMFSLWEERAKQPPSFDLVSILAHSDLMNALTPVEKLGTLITFLVGGNDTTRHTMTGGLWALAENPDELAKLRADPALIPSFIQESLRWQTSSMHMRRTAVTDIDFRGRRIRKGDKVVLWYISANRDESVIDQADQFIVDRPKPAPMLTFGHGVHRCLGARLAELQLKILWEEFFARDFNFEVLGEPAYIYSNNMRGIESMSVIIHD